MAYRPPSKQAAEAPAVVHSIDKLLSFRDTWRQPLTNFSFDALINKKNEAAAAAAEKITENVAPLVHSDDGFHVIDKTKLSDEEKLIRDAQRALNQLAEENFEAVVEPLLHAALFETKTATQVVERIFEKCIEEPKFAPLYARMCLRFCMYEHEYLKGGSSFRRCLITKVQALFEEEPVPLEKKFTDEDMSAARKRKMANTQLVGQLLLCGVLSRKVYSAILDSIFVVPQHPPEINVEVGAQLIEIVCTATPDEYQKVGIKKEGMVIPLNPFQFDKILTMVLPRINLLCSEDNFCKRVQFKLMEILDMSKRGWLLRPVAQATKAKAANPDGMPQTPLTAETPGSTVSVGTPLFPKSANAIPKNIPKVSSAQKKQFVTALSTVTPSETVTFTATVKEISIVLTGSTVTVNHMACLSCYMDSVARLHDSSKHTDAIEILASPIWDASEVAVAFLWTIVEGIRQSIREDVPKYFDRLALFFAHAILVKRQTPFIALIRDMFVPVTERIGESIKNAEKEGIDEEMCAEEFVHAWESFIKVSTAVAVENKIELPKFAECADLWSKSPFEGPMAEIALEDVVGSFISHGVAKDTEMRQWVTANAKNKQAQAFVNACDLLC